MKKVIGLLSISILLISSACSKKGSKVSTNDASSNPNEEVVNKPTEEVKAEEVPTEIHWMTIEEAARAVEKEPRKIMVDVYTSWCGPCKLLDKKTFHNKKVVEYVSKNFYAVKFDAEGKTPITFKGKTFKNPSRTHEFTYHLGVTGYPTVAFFDENLNLETRTVGFYDAPEFLKALKKIQPN